MQKIIEKKFSDWTEQELIFQLGLHQASSSPILEEWLDVKNIELSTREKFELDFLYEKVNSFIVGWNESEIREQFIAPLIYLIDFSSKKLKFSSFSERGFEAQYYNYKLHGKIDWMAASGLYDPIVPFFFLHEYKPEKARNKDPRGQLLVGMLSAYLQHQIVPEPSPANPAPKHFYKDIPIYGCYVIGRFWFFTVLNRKEYAFSSAFDVTDREKLLHVFKILKAQKKRIENLLSENVIL